MESLFTMATLRIAILLMKNVFDRNVLERRIDEFLELGRQVFRNRFGLKFLKSVIIYLYQATDIKTEKIVRVVSEINAKGGSIAMSTAEKLRKEGKKEGRKESIVFLVRNAKKQGLSEETIAGIVGLDTASVRKILNREDFDVPLHLLDREDGP